MSVQLKDPQDVRDYAIDWTLPEGDSIANATWDVATGDVNIDSSSIDGARTIVWLSGGTLGTDASVTCHVTTSDGREGDKTLHFTIRHR